MLITKAMHPLADPPRFTCIPDNRASRSGWQSFKSGIQTWMKQLNAHAKREGSPSALTKALYADAKDNLEYADTAIEEIRLLESDDPKDFDALLAFAELEREVSEEARIDVEFNKLLAADDDAPGNLEDKSAAHWRKGAADIDAEFNALLIDAEFEGLLIDAQFQSLLRG